jgi:hypothetical protein
LVQLPEACFDLCNGKDPPIVCLCQGQRPANLAEIFPLFLPLLGFNSQAATLDTALRAFVGLEISLGHFVDFFVFVLLLDLALDLAFVSHNQSQVRTLSSGLAIIDLNFFAFALVLVFLVVVSLQAHDIIIILIFHISFCESVLGVLAHDDVVVDFIHELVSDD